MDGLLFSQIGYEPGLPVRVIVRRGANETLPPGAFCRITFSSGAVVSAPLTEWGTLWKSKWWCAVFPPETPVGEAGIEVVAESEILMADEGFRIGNNLLWDATVIPMATDMLECRNRIAKADHGWQDAGVMWQENNSHSAMVIGLTDVLEFASDRLDDETRQRVEAQIIEGCLYLVDTQNEAARHGHPQGSVCHDLLGHEDTALPNDTLKAAVAWRRAQRFLGADKQAHRDTFATAAGLALNWLCNDARPCGDASFCRKQRGLPEHASIPVDEWMTRDLVMKLWAALESACCGDASMPGVAFDTARQIMGRQITATNAEAGFYGHFREFESTPYSEKAWCHCIIGKSFGADIGGTFPHYLVPLVRLLESYPEHPDADSWRNTLQQFAVGFLIPACTANPFLIAPYGIFADEGPIWFAGPWHGFNCVYGWTAALAIELSQLLDEPILRDIAWANMQWIAGLNAGVTKESIIPSCHMWRRDIAPGRAIPFSMIHGVGNRSAGTWFGTRGVICNGFATGDQFLFDTLPVREHDGPFAFTDEDWIPHSAAWLSAIARLR